MTSTVRGNAWYPLLALVFSSLFTAMISYGFIQRSKPMGISDAPIVLTVGIVWFATVFVILVFRAERKAAGKVI